MGDTIMITGDWPTLWSEPHFMYTAAHQFGRDVLYAEKGLYWSWTHEGTTTIFGQIHSKTPYIPPYPSSINLMSYYFDHFVLNDFNRFVYLLAN